MEMQVRRLQPGDEPLLRQLALDEADFDVDGRGAAAQPIEGAAATAYLQNPSVLHWVALDGERLLGDLQCVVIPLPDASVRELLLYDIGVRSTARRCGVGRALLRAMEGWMHEHDVSEVWVLADNEGAVAFYRGCGFEEAGEQPVYMTRSAGRS